MSRSQVRLAPLLAVLTTALLVLASTGVATAGPTAVRTSDTIRLDGGTPTVLPDPPDVPRAWFATPCATGQLNEPYRYDGYPMVAVTGQITNCGPNWSMARFTLVSFPAANDHGYAFDSQLRPYQPTGVPTPVEATMFRQPVPGELGVCLMRTVAAPVACLRLTFDADLEMTWQPIPVDDPLVQKPVFLIDDSDLGDPGGFCGTCFRLA
ncbi:hypothetical protein ACI2K4_06175 [Micromonospora sp. NPDC050397]|uniref:hypothetical protein n=1 Tax=Micromonospora sp. NPDC050397 TaxID=3364279 RepID=UPI00384F8492